MTEDLQPYLSATEFVNSDSPAIRELADEIVGHCPDPVERACRLFYAVRDGIRYTAYNIDLHREAFTAAHVLAAGASWCVPKSVLLAAMCRAAGIPCRLNYADVQNHMATKKLREAMGTDIFYYHGYNEIYLRGRWVKATVAFNRTLCEKARVGTLEFDGVHDSIYHPLDLAGHKYMEYLHDYGPFADVPYEAIIAKFDLCYPRFQRATPKTGSTSQFEAEIQSEAAGK